MLMRLRIGQRTPTRVVSCLRTLSTKVPATTEILGQKYPTDEWTNVPSNIIGLLGRNLHRDNKHPLGIIRGLFESQLKSQGFTFHNNFGPVVSVYDNFDALGFPEDHPGRSKIDTYYVNKDTLLRTHTSAHEIECFIQAKNEGKPGYLISADVYRRDTIDKTHYSAFHQMEGARVWKRGPDLIETLKKDIADLPESGIIVEDLPGKFSETNPKQQTMSDIETELVGTHLKRSLEQVMGYVFNKAKDAAIAAGSQDPDLFQPIRARWIEAYFPWTAPSWEIEIWWKGEWLEMCGCGVVRKEVLDASGMGEDHLGWAFGIGLERCAMILFGIPDIRLFWSQDERFLSQFKEGEVISYKPFSKYPSTSRDVAFWVNNPEKNAVAENDLMEDIRGIAGDLVENVSLTDEFIHPKTKRVSNCYRITYQSMERSLTNDEINKLQKEIVDLIGKKYDVEIRASVLTQTLFCYQPLFGKLDALSEQWYD